MGNALELSFGIAIALLLATSSHEAMGAQVSDPADCPGVIVTGPASYQLTADLDDCWLTPAGVSALPPLSIDLDGHVWSNSFISLTSDGSRLANGTFDHSTVWIAGTLDHVTMRNGHDFSLEAFGLLSVTDSTFESNEIGLSAYFGSAAVQHSVFRDNTIGVVIGRGSGSSVEASQLQGNGQGVLLWDEDDFGSDDVVVQHNRFVTNGVGIRVTAFASVARAQLDGNQLDGNDGTGIDVTVLCGVGSTCGGQDMLIERNHLRGNGFAPVTSGAGDGLRVRGQENLGPPVDPTWITLLRNQSDGNAALGIDAPGVTDGGKNRAKRNGDPRQCVGVDCGAPAAKAGGKKKGESAAGTRIATQPPAADPLSSLLAGLPHH